MIPLDSFTLLCCGLLIGNELCVSLFINPVIRRCDDPVQKDLVARFSARFGALMPFWYALCLLLLLAECVVRRGLPGAYWIYVAAALWLTSLAGTILFLVPINNRLAKGGMSFESLRASHSLWEQGHRIRIALLVLSFLSLEFGVLR